MSKHTPGPWVVSGFADDLVEAPELDLVVAITDCSLISVRLPKMDAIEANARLISAAPDMAEALRRLLKWVEPIAGDNRDDAAEKEELASVEAARAALKKAGIE